VQLACIVQARPEEIRSLCGAEILCIPDPQLRSYQAAGLERMPLWRLLTSGALFRRRNEAARAGFRQNWRRTFARSSDTLRLPGAALVGRGGRILWMYRGEHPGDLPSGDNLVAIASEFTLFVRR